MVKGHFLTMMYGMIPFFKLYINKESIKEHAAVKKGLKASTGYE